MAGELMLQVTAAGLRLIHCATFALVHEQFFAKNITVATANLTQVVLALTGGDLIYLELVVQGASSTLQIVRQVTLDQDIACLSLQPTTYEKLSPATIAAAAANAAAHAGTDGAMDVVDPATTATVNYSEKSPLLAVGMWTDNSVRLFALPTVEEITRSGLDTDTQARDILLLLYEDKIFLFVGMGDGGLITYNLEATSGSAQLVNRRKGILGTHPITFTRFFSGANQEVCVFAACDRPTVIYIRNGKIIFSMLDLQQPGQTSGTSSSTSNEEVTNMAPFHSELFPDCLALSTESSLRIGTVEDIQKVHVRTVPLEESPRRIVYSATHGIYAVLTEKTTENEHGGESRSRILFFNEAFESLGLFELEYLEQAMALTLCTFEGADKPHIVVGTAQVVAEELEPSRGRILVFDVTADQKFVLIAEKETKAAVYSLTGIVGRLAAGIANRVQIFKLLLKDDKGGVGSSASAAASSSAFAVHAELQPECSVAEHTMVLHLKARGEYLVVGDVQRSLSLLRYKPLESSLEEASRDFNSSMLRSVEVVPALDDLYLAMDDHGNLFALKHRLQNASEEEQCKLVVANEFSIGDYTNVMRPGSIVAQPLINEGAVGAGLNSSSAMEVEGNEDVGSNGAGAGILDIFNPNYRSVTGFPLEKNSVLFGTVSGMLGSIFVLNESSYQFFLAVQNAVKKVYQPVKGFLHEEWRSFQNDHRTGAVKNVVDGDLVEVLLDLDRQQLEVVTRDINDELTTIIQSQGHQNGATAAHSNNSESAQALITTLATGRVHFTPEEILRRVEDISRLH